jgi:hypothetical protein
MRRKQMHRHMTIPLGILAICMVVGAKRVAGHHGWSGYDSGQTLNLTGTIEESGYEHPHGYIKLTVREKVWLVVLAPPSRMENRGLPRSMLQTGTQASVVGYPSRSDAHEMRAERITIDSKTVELR